MMTVHYKTILDTRRKKNDDNYPVKLRITYDRNQKYYATGISLTIEQWEVIQSHKAKKELKQIEETLDAIKVKAKGIIDSMNYFDPSVFETKFYQVRNSKGALVNLFTEYVGELKEQKRISTAVAYQAAITSLQVYKEGLDFKDITPAFLNNYENWMLGQGKSSTTVGMYLRALRSIFNLAISKDIIQQELYPFGKRKYQIPTGANIKKALTATELQKLINYPNDSTPATRRALDFWLFSYLCQGMNPKDIALLKFKNIDGDELFFQRAKTQKTAKANPIIIRVSISTRISEIIERWRNSDNTNSDNFVFPILTHSMTAEQQYATIQQFTKTINKYVDQVAKEVGIEKKVRTYSARHSFSTRLKTKGASIEYIAESLGHTDIKTTQAYLDSFDSDTKKLWAEKLLEF